MFRRGQRITAVVATAAALSACGQVDKYDRARASLDGFSAVERFNHDFRAERRGTGDVYLGQSCLKDTVFTVQDEAYGSHRRPASAEIADLGEGKIDVKSITGAVLHLVIKDNEHALDVREQDVATIATLEGYGCYPGAPFENTTPQN